MLKTTPFSEWYTNSTMQTWYHNIIIIISGDTDVPIKVLSTSTIFHTFFCVFGIAIGGHAAHK